MSVDDLYTIETHLNELKKYIDEIPQSLSPEGIKIPIKHAISAFQNPYVNPYVEDLKYYLPQEVDRNLTILSRNYCSRLSEPYSTDILDKVKQILSELKTFRLQVARSQFVKNSIPLNQYFVSYADRLVK